ncbi:MAG TPA: phosphatidylinositol mannoside acyltransferase [Candidatus Nanopelagicales bacterium]|nr:phosphatidylinositol mannoside acyltransferase [Candidatus Nanopelagicales bacterium]
MPEGVASVRTAASQSLTAWLYDVGWKVTRTLPEPAANAVFRQMADTLWRRGAGGVVQLEQNLRRVHPNTSNGEIRELSREGMRSYLRYWCEAFRLPSWPQARIEETFILERRELLDDALDQGGALMIPGHMANWDHAGAWAATRYGSITSVAERLKPEKLFEKFLDYRRELGMDILGTGESDVLRQLTRRLREGKLVALLGDRDISHNGVRVDFFGEPASFPAGPAVLAMMTDVPLHPVTMWFDGDVCRGYVHDRIELPTEGERTDRIRAVTQQLAQGWEAGIREHSTDWHMLQKVWVADLDDRHRQVPA